MEHLITPVSLFVLGKRIRGSRAAWIWFKMVLVHFLEDCEFLVIGDFGSMMSKFVGISGGFKQSGSNGTVALGGTLVVVRLRSDTKAWVPTLTTAQGGRDNA